MFRLAHRLAVFLTACLAMLAMAGTQPASAQIKWGGTYSDEKIVVGTPAIGFADGIVTGSTTFGQLRRDSVTAAPHDLNTVFDGRGTVRDDWNLSANQPAEDGFITPASFGRGGSSGLTSSGYFLGGPGYDLARGNATLTSGPTGPGQVNLNSAVNWYSAVPGSPTTLNSGTVDYISTLLPGMAFAQDLGSGQTRRFQPHEIGMPLDLDKDVYHRHDSTGNWKDGVTTATLPDDRPTLSHAAWRIDRGIDLRADGGASYNTHTARTPAPLLPPHGQVTPNRVLNFRGSGGVSDTPANDVGSLRRSRLDPSSTSSVPDTSVRGLFSLRQTSNGSAGVPTLRVARQNTGAFPILSAVQTNRVPTQAVGGAAVPNSAGLTVVERRSGGVNSGGVIPDDGALTKTGSSTRETDGPSANTFNGLTVVRLARMAVIALGVGAFLRWKKRSHQETAPAA